MEKQGLYLVVADTYIKYVKPAKYEETVIVKTMIKEINKASVVFEYEVKNGTTNDLLATGNSKLVAVTKEGKVTSIPDNIRKIL
jgi:acyl-CoA thioester hydrolase